MLLSRRHKKSTHSFTKVHWNVMRKLDFFSKTTFCSDNELKHFLIQLVYFSYQEILFVLPHCAAIVLGFINFSFKHRWLKIRMLLTTSPDIISPHQYDFVLFCSWKSTPEKQLHSCLSNLSRWCCNRLTGVIHKRRW